MNLIAFGALAVLNVYIGYLVIKYVFFEDGWSFMAGFMFFTVFIVSVPALIFSGLSVSIVRSGNRKKCVFPVILGMAGILAGLILHNATVLWIYIEALAILLLISCFVCRKTKDMNEL